MAAGDCCSGVLAAGVPKPVGEEGVPKPDDEAGVPKREVCWLGGVPKAGVAGVVGKVGAPKGDAGDALLGVAAPKAVAVIAPNTVAA